MWHDSVDSDMFDFEDIMFLATICSLHHQLIAPRQLDQLAWYSIRARCTVHNVHQTHVYAVRHA